MFLAMSEKKEIGSFFELADSSIISAEENFVPKQFADTLWVPSGRDAFIALAKNFGEKKTLHVPFYYCHLTLEIIKRNFNVKHYEDLPTEPSPRFETINAKPGDLILAVNFFGSRNADTWKQFAEANPTASIVEDHSHAPFSKWAKSSCAEFSLASLRKSFPLPCGGYLRGKQLKHLEAPKGGEYEANEIRAQYLKTLYCAGAKIDTKSFIDLFLKVEAHYDNNNDWAEMSDMAKEVLVHLDIDKMQSLRESNFGAISPYIDGSFYTFINRETSDKFSRFNPTFVLKDFETREALQKTLSANGIYPTVLWNIEKNTESEEARKLSDSIITVPLDFRCSARECEFVGNILKKFAGKKIKA
jgi:hypothetical protein